MDLSRNMISLGECYCMFGGKPVLSISITYLIYDTLFPEYFWFISPKAKLHLIYKDWLPGKSRQESAVSSEGQLKEKGLILSRESSAVVWMQGMKHPGLKSSAICENKNPYYHVFVPQVCRWLYNFFFIVDAVSFCIGRKNNRLIVSEVLSISRSNHLIVLSLCLPL